MVTVMDDRTGPNNRTGPNWYGGPRFWSEFYLVRSVVRSYLVRYFGPVRGPNLIGPKFWSGPWSELIWSEILVRSVVRTKLVRN